MHIWLPENVSTFGEKIDSIFYLIYYVTNFTFIAVISVMIAFLVMYRHREGRRATYSHGNSTLEIAWTVTPAVILLLLGFASKARWEEIKATQPPADVTVRVTGLQFNWEVRYPGPDAKFETDDDYEVLNDVHVPVGKVVHVHLRSKDVIHSFFLPHLRVKIMVWFQATKAGEYPLPCAELCGFGHSGMLGRLVVHEPADYDAWLKERWPS
jgi:cytochrome c oxidase subunit 2